MALALIYLSLLAFVPYLIAVWRASRLEWQRWRWLIIGVAVAARLALLPLPPLLSEDVYRYAWEGKVQRAGFNPYRYGPEAAELAGLRDATWELVTHREVPSAYPPLLLLVFRLVPEPWMFKVIFAGFDLATFWLLVKLLRMRGQNESLALIWALNPLVVLEFAGNGHEMSMAICFFVAGLLCLELEGRAPARPHDALQQRPGWSQALQAAAFAAAMLSQVLAWPLVLVTLGAARIKSVRFWATFVVVMLVCFAPFLDAGAHLADGLIHYGARWRFNGSLFEILVAVMDGESQQRIAGGIWLAYLWPKLIVAGMVAVVFAWTRIRRFNIARTGLAVMGAVLLLSPTVHPWYVTWLVALTCLELRAAWVVWSGTVLLSYAGVSTWWEYAPVFAFLIWETLPSTIAARWLQQKL